MSRGDPSEARNFEMARDSAWAELCGTDEDEAPEEELAAYGSLLGLGVRKAAKKPVIVLDPEVAEKAAQVMEINAGQLVVNPGQAIPGFAGLGLDPLGAEEEEDEPLDALEEEEQPADDEDDDDAVLAEWANRTTELSDVGDEPFEAAELPECAEPASSPVDLAQPESEPEPAYELSVEAEETWADETVEEAAEEVVPEQSVREETVSEEDALDQAWLEWARSLTPAGEPVFADEDADDFEEPEALDDEAGDYSTPLEAAALLEEPAEIEPETPELPRHELRVMVAQLSRPRKTEAQRLWIRARRLWVLVKRIFAA
jgi:hypothetical protein